MAIISHQILIIFIGKNINVTISRQWIFWASGETNTWAELWLFLDCYGLLWYKACRVSSRVFIFYTPRSLSYHCVAFDLQGKPFVTGCGLFWKAISHWLLSQVENKERGFTALTNRQFDKIWRVVWNAGTEPGVYYCINWCWCWKSLSNVSEKRKRKSASELTGNRKLKRLFHSSPHEVFFDSLTV